MKKIQFVSSIPSPYQVDFFNALQDLAPDSFSVVFSAGQEIDRQYYKVPKRFSFPAIILNHNIRKKGKDLHNNRELVETLRREGAETIVLGGNYFMPDALRTRKHCIREAKRFFFWGENPHKRQCSFWKKILKDQYLRWFLAPAHGTIGIGEAARKHYLKLAPTKQSVSIPYAPELLSILKPQRTLVQKSNSLNVDWGGDAVVNILYAGSLIPRKDPMTLVEAFGDLSMQCPTARLRIAGSGPLHDPLQQLVQQRGLGKKVDFLGYMQGDALKTAYMASDLFVIPTLGHEGWGVVVQEALAAGLPVLASSRVGAAVDLLEGEQTGQVFTPGNSGILCKVLQKWIENSKLRKEASARAREVVAGTSSRCAANQLLSFLEANEQPK
ncbi:MAG: glycosyltransferase family 4 protein [Akkermansiaceae bacterium]|nr:glycosyltransferase family 4 protein [Akkermansiaceae bacterium]